MLHPDTQLVFVSDVVGFGVIATRPIPRGTLTWVPDPLDQRIDPARLESLPRAFRELVDRYSFDDGAGRHVLCWDHSRFVNHSCAPTGMSAGYEFEVAVRDIRAGEQLTNDYASLNIDAAFRCACGEATCRGAVRPTDALFLAPHWDDQVRRALASWREVAQPLVPLLDDTERARLESSSSAFRGSAESVTVLREQPPSSRG